MSLITITNAVISPQTIVEEVKTDGSGCVVTYVGLIRDNSNDKKVRSVEYRDMDGKAVARLQRIANETKQKWELEDIAFVHRVGTLEVGDINLVIVVAAGHRQEGFAACQFMIDRFKETLPTHKTETYQDGSVYVQEP